MFVPKCTFTQPHLRDELSIKHAAPAMIEGSDARVPSATIDTAVEAPELIALVSCDCVVATPDETCSHIYFKRENLRISMRIDLEVLSSFDLFIITTSTSHSECVSE